MSDNKEIPIIRFKKTHQDAKLPTRKHVSDSGADIYAVEDVLIQAQKSVIVETGIQVAYITPGYWFKVESRSGLSFNHGVLAHPGIIDQNYRGGLGILLYNHGHLNYQVNKGDRIAQIVLYKLQECNVEWAKEVDETDRGSNGFGSSGK
jgi:dUTP pyrophosphatase